MAPLSTNYFSEVQKWLQHHSRRPITINQIGKLFGSAYIKATCVQTAVTGFRKYGIILLIPMFFSD